LKFFNFSYNNAIVCSYHLSCFIMQLFKKDKPDSPQYSMPKPRKVIMPAGMEEQAPAQQDPQTKNGQSNKSNLLMSWSFKQFETVPRPRSWYIGFFVVIALLLAYGLFTNNFLLGIIAILIALMYYLFEKREPQDFRFGITQEGVLAQDRLYEFSSLESFWIFYEPQGRKELSLKSVKNLVPYIHIPLGDADPVEVRNVLMQFLPEIEHIESVADSINQMM